MFQDFLFQVFCLYVSHRPPDKPIFVISYFKILQWHPHKKCATAVHNQRRCKIKVSIIDDRSCKFTVGVIFTSGHSFPQIYIDRLCCVKDAGGKFLSLILLIFYRRCIYISFNGTVQYKEYNEMFFFHPVLFK
jgi:hypothetical protein